MKNEIKVFKTVTTKGIRVTAIVRMEALGPKTVRPARDLLTDHSKYRLNQASGLFEIRYASEDADAIPGDIKRLLTAVNIFARASGLRVEYINRR